MDSNVDPTFGARGLACRHGYLSALTQRESIMLDHTADNLTHSLNGTVSFAGYVHDGSPSGRSPLGSPLGTPHLLASRSVQSLRSSVPTNPTSPAHAVRRALLGVHSHRMLIGACDPMVCSLRPMQLRDAAERRPDLAARR